MSYEKQTWVTGDVITANKLNHIENGIDNIMIVTSIWNENTQKTVLDKTFNQIKEAYENGKIVMYKSITENESDGAYNYIYNYLMGLAYEEGSTPLCQIGFGHIYFNASDDSADLIYEEYRSTSPEGDMEIYIPLMPISEDGEVLA